MWERYPPVTGPVRSSKAGSETPRYRLVRVFGHHDGPRAPGRGRLASAILSHGGTCIRQRFRKRVVRGRILRPRVGELVDYPSEWDRAPSVRRLERGRDGIIRRLVESDRDGRTQDGPRNVEGRIPRPYRQRHSDSDRWGWLVPRRDAGNAPRAPRGGLRRTDVSLLGLDRRREVVRDRRPPGRERPVGRGRELGDRRNPGQ